MPHVEELSKENCDFTKLLPNENRNMLIKSNLAEEVMENIYYVKLGILANAIPLYYSKIIDITKLTKSELLDVMSIKL